MIKLDALDPGRIADLALKHVVAEDLRAPLEDGRVVLLRGRKKDVLIGESVPVKVNTNIGISIETPYEMESAKVKTIAAVNYHPDLMMDHTIIAEQRQFWKELLAIFEGPVGTLPHYTVYTPGDGIGASAILDRIEEMLEGGVAFMTLHFTADRDLYDLAKKTRSVPVTARGGGLVLRDLMKNGGLDNIFIRLFDEIIKLFKKYDAAISIGTTFRPANVVSALDAVHVAETARQIEIIRLLKNAGVKVLMEGVGHVPLDKIQPYIELKKAANCPFMPLGPMTTDSAIGFDHVTSAIGGSMMAWLGGAQVLNSVTREEHTGGVPTVESILEGLKSARVAAHSVNVAKFPSFMMMDNLTVDRRAKLVSCVVSGGLFDAEIKNSKKGCTRCSFECPLILAPINPAQELKN